MTTSDEGQARRWRLVLGAPAESGVGGLTSAEDTAMDRALSALYNDDEQTRSEKRAAGLSGSAPKVARWLGDIRSYFPSTVVASSCSEPSASPTTSSALM